MILMNSLERLKEITLEFFDNHWGSSDVKPEWDDSWDWCGAVPNYKLGGLYALFSGDNLIYIGLGNSRGGGSYKEHGISRRLLSHVLKISPDDHPHSYMPQERWEKAKINKLVTIGFPANLNYLAPALEDFLIGEINPPENSIKRKS